MLAQSIPDTQEFSQQASGPAKGKISRNSPEFEKLEPCYNNGIIFRDEEGTGADRLMSKVGVLSFVYFLYLTFHHFKCTACNFLWGLCTLDRSACGARCPFIHRFTTTIVKKLRELSCCRFFSSAMQREIDNVGGFSERRMAFCKAHGDRGLGWTRPAPANSLYYEGRAVDLRLSDRDKDKIGLLGRLAVEAGFDWVLYESRSHIHASVREGKYS